MLKRNVSIVRALSRTASPSPIADRRRIVPARGRFHHGHLTFDRRSVHVRQNRTRVREEDGGYVGIDGPPKTNGSATTIDGLKKSTMQALMDLPMSDDPKKDYVFRNGSGGPFDPDHLDRIFRGHLKAAGLPDMGFHVLRHTCATQMIAAGEHVKAIQHRMRHAEIGTTMDTYGHLLPSAHGGIGDRMEAWEALQEQQRSSHSLSSGFPSQSSFSWG